MEQDSNGNTTLITKGVRQVSGGERRTHMEAEHIKTKGGAYNTHTHTHGCDTGLLESPGECSSELFRLEWLHPKYHHP